MKNIRNIAIIAAIIAVGAVAFFAMQRRSHSEQNVTIQKTCYCLGVPVPCGTCG